MLPPDLSGKADHEILFWGGGHALQFTWTLLMLVSWLWLASVCGARMPISPRLTLLMFVLALASVFVTPYAYLAYDVATVEHRNLHTWAMRLGGGLAIAPIALSVWLGLRAVGPMVDTICSSRRSITPRMMVFDGSCCRTERSSLGCAASIETWHGAIARIPAGRNSRPACRARLPHSRSRDASRSCP